MKNNLTILSLCFLLNGCVGQIKSDLPGQKLKPIVEDPYFVETQDTVSTSGPFSITRNIMQDRNGIFWLATWQGIVSYDGQQYTNHTLKSGLRRFHVFSVLEDSSGNLWFGTIGGGVYRYDGKTFANFTTQDGIANNDVLCMMQDNAGNIWFGTDDGVSLYNGKSFTTFTTVDGIGGPSVNSIIQDKNGTLWFGTRYGMVSDVSQYDGKSFKLFSNPIGTPFSNVRSILEDKNGDIWIGGQTGLFRYNGQTITSVSTKFIGYIFEDMAGTIWLSLGDTNGMTLSRYDGKEITRVSVGEQVFGITEDGAGEIWFGTVHGAVRFNPSMSVQLR